MKKTLMLAAAGAAMLVAACGGNGCNKGGCENAKPADSLMVVLDLHRTVKPECVSAFKASFARCKELTVKEDGCVDYGLYQSPDDSTRFLIYEVWANQTVLSAHWQTAHLKAHVEEIKDMVTAKWDRHLHIPAANMEETRQ